jgi:hypothetical protein
MSHVINQSPTYSSHVGELSTTYASHVEEKKPTTAIHVGGIDSSEKHRWIGRNPKFPCNICKGGHLPHLCPGLLEARRLWSLSTIFCDSKSSEVSSQFIQPLFDEVVMLMQSSANPTSLLGGDAPLYHVVS